MEVGFIGLGRMGQGMASNLQRLGTRLTVFDTYATALQPLLELGAKKAKGPGELAAQCDVIFTSLPGPAQVEDVVLGVGGVLDNIQPGAALFDLTTSSATLARRIEAQMKLRGASMLDAPVSGQPSGAASGELALWVGGDREVFDQHLDLLKLIGNSPHYVGGVGSGTVTKLAHNVVGYMVLLSLAESFSMAVKAGVEPLELWKALKLGVIGKKSPLDMLTKQFLPGQFETPAFALALAHKDVRLATDLAKELGVPMRLANLTLEEMTEGMARGFGAQDARAFLKLQLERAGVDIAVDPTALQEAIDTLG